MRFGTAAIVGRTNVGKSTFLNAALGEPLAIVSSRPQTTRDALLGVVSLPDAQIAFLDTPGFHRPRTELGKRMNAAAREAARVADVVVVMIDVGTLVDSVEKAEKNPVLEEDAALVRDVPHEQACLVVINKVDLLRDKQRLLPMLAKLAELRPLAACVPISSKQKDGVALVLNEIAALLPEGPKGYDDATITDKPTRFFVREYVREQVLVATDGEVPHAVAVTVEEFSETPKVVVIKATIHVEKAGQRAIVVGKGGAKIKEIGIGARKRLEELLEHKVHLELFVRITDRWKSMPRQLTELGYDAATADAGDRPAVFADDTDGEES
jgi:GTP-binding protein Era